MTSTISMAEMEPQNMTEPLLCFIDSCTPFQDVPRFKLIAIQESPCWCKIQFYFHLFVWQLYEKCQTLWHFSWILQKKWEQMVCFVFFCHRLPVTKSPKIQIKSGSLLLCIDPTAVHPFSSVPFLSLNDSQINVKQLNKQTTKKSFI